MWRTEFERQQVESIVTDPRDDWRCPCPSLPLISFFTGFQRVRWAPLRCELLLHHNLQGRGCLLPTPRWTQ